jgi:hypothetical protein
VRSPTCSLLVFRSICFALWVSALSATGHRPAVGCFLDRPGKPGWVRPGGSGWAGGGAAASGPRAAEDGWRVRMWGAGGWAVETTRGAGGGSGEEGEVVRTAEVGSGVVKARAVALVRLVGSFVVRVRSAARVVVVMPLPVALASRPSPLGPDSLVRAVSRCRVPCRTGVSAPPWAGGAEWVGAGAGGSPDTVHHSLGTTPASRTTEV